MCLDNLRSGSPPATFPPAESLYEQAEAALEVACETAGPVSFKQNAVSRGGLLLLLSGFEIFNCKLLARLLLLESNTTKVNLESGDPEEKGLFKVRDSRTEQWKRFLDVRQLRVRLSGILDERSIANSLKRKTINRPIQIDEYLTYFGVDTEELWTSISKRIEGADSGDDVRKLLLLFVDRRNDIAHEGDWIESISRPKPFAPEYLQRAIELIRITTDEIVQRTLVAQPQMKQASSLW